ncbi:hypothetical protein J6590_068795 [Homalodisca vitripennis]|nr:hypothetical protein J6590_068795 [Homalodisca vitripennis]
MEKVVTEQIISYIENEKIVSETQSGFRRGFSTCSALLNMVDEVCRARNNKMCSVVAALDYRQAFDSLPPRRQTVTIVHKVLDTGRPAYLNKRLMLRSAVRERHTRQDAMLQLPKVHLERGKRGFSYFGPKEFNALPPADEEVRPGPHNHSPDVLHFKAELKRRAATERRLSPRKIFDEVSLQGIIGPGDEQGCSAAEYLQSARLQEALSNSRRIHMDATFKVLPLQLGTRLQLLTVHAEYLNYLSCSIRDNDQKDAAGIRGGGPVYHAVSAALATGNCLGRLGDGYPECRSPGLASCKDSGMLFPLRPGNIPHAFHSATAALNSSQSRGWQGIVHAHGAMPSFCREDTDWATYMENTWMRLLGPETFGVFGQSASPENGASPCSLAVPCINKSQSGELRAIESAQYLDYRRVSHNTQGIQTSKYYNIYKIRATDARHMMRLSSST